MPTSRNARGIDLLVYDAKAERKLGIQVKALSKKDAVSLGKSVDAVLGDFWIIVTKAITTEPECFVMTPDEVRLLAHRNEKDGKPSYWLEFEHISHRRVSRGLAPDRVGRLTCRPSGSPRSR